MTSIIVSKIVLIANLCCAIFVTTVCADVDISVINDKRASSDRTIAAGAADRASETYAIDNEAAVVFADHGSIAAMTDKPLVTVTTDQSPGVASGENFISVTRYSFTNGATNEGSATTNNSQIRSMIMRNEKSDTVITDASYSANTVMLSEPSTARPQCGSCPKRYIGGTALYIDTPIHSENVNEYASCKQSTECATVVSVPEGYYILFVLELYMVPGDTLSVYDGDVSPEDADQRKPLAVYGPDDTTTDGDITLESNGNRATLLFKFRYYGGHYPQSYYNVLYNAMKVDCLCPRVIATQPNSISFKSPNYPHYYCPASKCEYFINVTSRDAASYCANRPVLGLILSFTAFDLADQDYVSVYAVDIIEQWLVRYTGDMQPTSIELDTLRLKAVFSGEVAGDHFGFLAVVKINCGYAPDDGLPSADAFHLTMGTMAAIASCFLVALVAMIVAFVLIREKRRWQRRRELRNALRDLDEAGGSDSDVPISIIGPLPSYSDALHCLKWEPSAAVNPRLASAAESGATFPPQAAAPETGRAGPPPYSLDASPSVTECEPEASAIHRRDDLESSAATEHGIDNRGFKNDETCPNILSAAGLARCSNMPLAGEESTH